MQRLTTPALRRVLALLGGMVALATLLVAAPTGAAAAPATPAARPAGPVSVQDQTCPYPYVCFYNSGGTITGRFRDVTSGWQWLTSSRGAAYARNTRNDDVVFYHFTDGRQYCAAPRETTIFFAVVDAIRISWASTCP